MAAKKRAAAASTPAANEESRPALAHIEEALKGLRYGQVTIVVQDGVVVLIERTEKRRLV